MYVILVYDINQKRVGKALKICRKYLIHIQKSVFEGNITESKLSALKEEMNNLINTMQSAFEEKLGFLGQSLTFVVDEFNYLILKPDPFTGLCIPKISLPSEIANLDIISSETCLNDSIMSNFSLATNMIKIVNSFMLIGWFLSFAYNELQKWLGGNY